MSDSLRIQIVVDAGQVTAGMDGVTASVEAATARIKSAFGSVEKAPEGIRNALVILQNQSRMSGEAVAFAASAINELGAAAGGATPRVQGAGNAADDAARKMTALDRAMAFATGRMAGMAAGAGMLGGALGRVGAASSVLGPILATAFPVFAIAAFVDIADMAYQKILDFTSGVAGWDKEAQHMYDLLIGLNRQTVSFNANLAIEKLRLNEIGLKGSALDLQKEKDLKSELTIRTDELTASLQRENAIRAQLQGTSRTVDVMNPRTRTTQPMTVIDKPEKDEVTRLNKELANAIENSQKLTEEIRKLKDVSIPGEEKQGQADKAKEYEKEQEKIKKHNEEAIRSLIHWTLQQETLNDKVKELVNLQAEFSRKQDSGQLEAGSTTTASSFLPSRPPFLFCSSIIIRTVSLSVVSEIAIVPDSECSTPTLIVSLACAAPAAASSDAAHASRVKIFP